MQSDDRLRFNHLDASLSPFDGLQFDQLERIDSFIDCLIKNL